MNRHTQKTVLIAVLFSGLLNMQAPAAATLAGKVVFTQGQPQAIDTGGAARVLARGNEVYSGDKLVTGSGRLQISLIDGAFVSVQPNTEYQIENYNYSGSPDGTEIASYRLDKGGVRAITGLIGRQNPEAYKVHTAIATIGIRGTGHNTRVCQGDCGSRQDGLYHNTWEGITYVVNDVDSEDVPTGRGVYVEDIESEILFLDQPSVVTAVETTKEKRDTEQRETEEQTRIVSTGEQRDPEGDQQIVVAARGEDLVPSTVLTNIGLLGVVPDADEPDGVGVFSFEFGSSVFRRDSDSSGIAIFGFDDEDNLVLATIDPAAVRGGVDPSGTPVVSEAVALLDQADPAQVSLFEANPASVAEFFYNGEIGFGRWTGGRILVVDEFETELEELTGFQSVHFLFGTDPPALPTSGFANYTFLEGTQSTSVSGATIGDGVLNGFVSVDFGQGSGFLNLDVRHDSNDIFISGPLGFVSDGSLSDIINGVPGVFASGGPCISSCQTFIDAGFVGPASGSSPKHIALEYDIQTADVIMGVAAFGLVP